MTGSDSTDTNSGVIQVKFHHSGDCSDSVRVSSDIRVIVSSSKSSLGLGLGCQRPPNDKDDADILACTAEGKSSTSSNSSSDATTATIKTTTDKTITTTSTSTAKNTKFINSLRVSKLDSELKESLQHVDITPDRNLRMDRNMKIASEAAVRCLKT
mmetsp:Transcript_6637/g.12209  ORF Transcript_6637/g.12209 Transcript_6637/m.12209 type:complete len:156 (-) Transcript_6637:115-582(-)